MALALNNLKNVDMSLNKETNQPLSSMDTYNKHYSSLEFKIQQPDF